MQVGKWKITNGGIEWAGSIPSEYIIAKDRILEYGSGERSEIYDWLVHLPEKTWLKMDDIYAFNTVFLYAVGVYNMQINQQHLINSMLMQSEILNRK